MATLLSWLGRTDLDQMKLDKPASIATIALKGKTLDSIIILASTWDDEWHDYKEWLERKLACVGRSKTSVTIQRVRLASPIDYSSITKVMQKQLSKISAGSEDICLNLTSGTPAMTVVSVLLGKSIAKCQLLQTSPQGELIEVEIPVDFATEYTKSSTSAIQSLSSDAPHLSSAFEAITTKSKIMQVLVKKAHRLALSDLPALVLGESGSGKEVMATAIHNASSRSDNPFRAVNCGALPENLVDSILFGHVKGAFTGADKDYSGLFEQANGGTLFLDEVGELPLNVQVKLLRALQQKEITRVGDVKSRVVDVRIIAATHQNLFQMTSQGAFREDLFYRLAVGVIEMPPLRVRVEDIPELISTLMSDINQQAEKHPLFESKKISVDAINFAKSYPWPGNIRELWNTLNRAVLWSESSTISAEDLQSSVLSAGRRQSSQGEFFVPGDIQQYIDTIKKDAVESALEYSRNNKSKAAEALGLKSHQTLSGWMTKLGIEE
ncbi:sigma-54 interaction domain-containing protein [Vibrio diabolicus]|uniref:sigma-54 interaction domain-containing protein n=1 Tax=Vibrio diabolicus TaxID=50719 RepID=UPI0029415961|nr:sigma 54-interacting transcriptional regulator [Vibrio diabolicus]MDV5061689.1 sigma 54-interacting transcriptional regulator [Vibrio diabolicus]